MFLACLFIASFAGSEHAYATAPALFYVACLTLSELSQFDWEYVTEVIPACVTALTMPFSLRSLAYRRE